MTEAFLDRLEQQLRTIRCQARTEDLGPAATARIELGDIEHLLRFIENHRQLDIENTNLKRQIIEAKRHIDRASCCL